MSINNNPPVVLGCLLKYLKEENVKQVSIGRISEILYQYSENVNYAEIFINFQESDYLLKTFDLEEAIALLIQWGLVKKNPQNRDVLDLPESNDLTNHFNVNESVSTSLKQIANDIAPIADIEAQYDKIIIDQATPNSKILLRDGQDNGIFFKDVLYTDGDVYVPVTNVKSVNVVKNRVVEIKNATFAIIQKNYGYSSENAVIMAEHKDREFLSKLAAIALTDLTEQASLIAPKPAIYTLNLKNV